jgi:hypothetical protein
MRLARSSKDDKSPIVIALRRTGRGWAGGGFSTSPVMIWLH